MSWAVVPAAGSGARFGGELPKQYRRLAGEPVIVRTLSRLLAHPSIEGAMVALAVDDIHWSHLVPRFGKPVLTCIGGADRAASVLAALCALPVEVADEALVLVHDAARPCVRIVDLDRLIASALDDAVGALLAAPVRDTLKRADADGRVDATASRERLWRALTPQAFRRGALTRALESAQTDGVAVTDEAMAMERIGLRPLLVEGSEDNIKLTVAEDLALAEHILATQRREASA
ncbi:MAG TPA: 2-C-methyl-D-erythritol 4-phosphate cytidylyltransferase [Xanthomonadaceae bacterium]|jgi:2-C-methyl-D-erythritol 4-phosphate cytidylyltransferase|nr:2-C-methyl-D-erythritol 4-phosphate cytidylyltransferase [Xanthomonadaceae bacterium]